MTTEEKAVIDAAIQLHRTPGTDPMFHVVLGTLDFLVGNLLASRKKRAFHSKIPAFVNEPWASENIDGTWNVMLGDDIIAGPIPEKAEADEYVAAMKRGDC